MKHLLVLLTCVILLAMPTPAHSQAGCPPVTSPTATNMIYADNYQAWLDFRPYWQQCAPGAPVIGTDLGEAIVTIEFDPYLRQNLYAYGVNGGVYQINVATNHTVVLVSPIPPVTDTPGEASGETIGVNPTVEPTPAPVVRRPPMKPRIIVRFRLAGLWQ